jgi:hypothetical protein
MLFLNTSILMCHALYWDELTNQTDSENRQGRYLLKMRNPGGNCVED